jgi:DNA-binding protein
MDLVAGVRHLDLGTTTMFNGSVDLRAETHGAGLEFAPVAFDPKHQNVDHISIEAPPGGKEVKSTVRLKEVVTEAAGKEIALAVNEEALDRLTFFHKVPIRAARITSTNFVLVNPPPGCASVATAHMMMIVHAPSLLLGLDAAIARATLEDLTAPGSQHFSFFRSALQSNSPVEKFMHLYNVLLMILGDKQALVDQFIVAQEPTVTHTPRPDKPSILETTYSRLRNEFAHKRKAVDMRIAKQEMENAVGKLTEIVKTAIIQNP